MPHTLFSPYPKLPQQKQATFFAEQLLQWFTANKRNLPWRMDYDPYSVWISEIMLQQTQMERAVLYFIKWMKIFPTLEHLANANLDDVYTAWEGLGYYSRAKNLHATAQILVNHHSSNIPQDFATLITLPGIGPYTAGAILCIAYNKPHPAIDANALRVFSRLFNIDCIGNSPKSVKYCKELAVLCTPQNKARLFCQALMEFGALLCKKRPLCTQCPCKSLCQAAYHDLTFERPITGKKPSITPITMATGLLFYNGHIFVQKRLAHGAWANLWEFPGGTLEYEEEPAEGLLREFAEETEFTVNIFKKLGVVRHVYTRYKITLHGFLCTIKEPKASWMLDEKGFPTPNLHAAIKAFWAKPQEIEGLALPAGHRKLFAQHKNEIVLAVNSSLIMKS